MKQLCVLTGDLVGSTGLTSTALHSALETLGNSAQDIARWQSPPHDTRLTLSRGDGWQIVLHDPAMGLRAALYIQAAFISDHNGLRSKIAIATGAGTLPENGDLNSASGAAFTASGRALDSLKGALMVHAAGGALGAAVRLADHIAQGWTEAQARAVHAMLWPRDRTQAEAAQIIGISRQAVGQALHGAGFAALEQALAMIEAPAQDAS